jgi:transportin-2
LKNTIKQNWANTPDQIRFYLKRNCFTAIGDPSSLVRATVGIIITTIFMHEGVQGWPELLHTLCQFLADGQAQDVNTIEVRVYKMQCHLLHVLLQQGTLGALQKICEDSADRMGQEQINLVVTKVLPFFNSPVAKLRSLSVNTVNCILLVQNESITNLIDPFLQCLFRLADDEDQVLPFPILSSNFPSSGSAKAAVPFPHPPSGKLHREDCAPVAEHRRVHADAHAGRQ